MATLSAARASATRPVYKPAGGGTVAVAQGVYEIAANPTAADIIELFRLPAGAVVFDGAVRGDDIDTGTEALDFDIGWAANGTDAADPDGFGNFGVVTGDPVTELKPETQIYLPFNGTLKDGPVTFSAETVVQIVVNAPANAGGTGTIWAYALYYVP